MQNTEYEYKKLICAEEYMRLLVLLDELFVCREAVQINYYYDDSSFSLCEKGETLRVRRQSDRIILERKYNKRYCAGGERICDESSQMIEKLPLRISIDERCYCYVGNLVTKRRVYTIKEKVSVCLDLSCYLGNVDYEIEMESDREFVPPPYLADVFDGGACPEGKYRRFVRALCEMRRGNVTV